MRRGLIVSGGHVNHDLLLSLLNRNYDYVVAVDGGMNPLWVIHVEPDAILGDFDSCSSHALNTFRGNKVKEIKFDVRKDSTDTQLAIEHLIDLGIDEADILGATGTRFDHGLANVMLLFKYNDRIKLTLVDENNQIFVAEGLMTIEKGSYKYFSLLPISELVSGVSLKGVAYPLEFQTLKRESSFAISNEITGEMATLSFESGQLLVIQSND